MTEKSIIGIVNDFERWFESHYFKPLVNEKGIEIDNLIRMWDFTIYDNPLKNIFINVDTSLAYPSFYVRQKINEYRDILSKYLTDNNVGHTLKNDDGHKIVSIDYESFKPLLIKLMLEGEI